MRQKIWYYLVLIDDAGNTEIVARVKSWELVMRAMFAFEDYYGGKYTVVVR